MAVAFYISGSNVEMFGAAWFSDSFETCLPRNYKKINADILSKTALAKLHSGSHFVSFSTSIASIASLAQIAEVTCTVRQRVDYCICMRLFWNILKSNGYSFSVSCSTILYLLVVRLRQALLLLWACRNSSRFARMPQKAGSTSI